MRTELSADLSTILERLEMLVEALEEALDAPGQRHAGGVTQIGRDHVDLLRQALEELEPYSPPKDVGAAVRYDATHLAEYGLNMLAELSALAERLELNELCTEVELLSLPYALWITRRGAEISTLQPVVNALAKSANLRRDPMELAQLYRHIAELTEMVSPAARQETAETMHPWKLLLFNRAIVATRSLDPVLMEDAFEALVAYLPEEAPAFFEEGMGQMDVIGYPGKVREVMERYYRRHSQRRQIH
ncbi:MAG: hypothetical protein ABFS23_05565 [Pseudomonadota bacterium]